MKYKVKTLKVRDFTLIEILTVIAIIAILATMLFPASIRIQEGAKRVNCLNKHRNIGYLCNQFSGRNNGLVPINTDVAWQREGTVVYSDSDNNDGVTDTFLIKAKMNTWTRLRVDLGLYEPDEINAESAAGANKWSRDSGAYEINWAFFCDNTLTPWTGLCASSYDTHWTFAVEKSPKLSNYVINSGSIGLRFFSSSTFKYTPMIWNGGDSPYKGKFTEFDQYGKSTTATEYRLTLADVARPSVRAMGSEIGLRTDGGDDMYSDMYFKKYDDTINSRSGYIPGYGAAGVGQKSWEQKGYSNIFDPEDPIHQAVFKDVEEGRHDGFTIHLFYDGHVEAVSAEKVGSLQLESGEVAPETKAAAEKSSTQILEGMYGAPTYAGDDD